MKTLSSFQSDFGIEIADKSNGTVEASDMTTLLNRWIRRLQSRSDFLVVKNRATLNVFDSVGEYAAQSDFKELVDLYHPNTEVLVTRISPDKFWSGQHRQQPPNEILYAKDGLLGTKTLLLRNTKNAAVMLNACDSLTENGTWAANTATSDAANLATDTVNYKQGAASLSFDVTAGQSVNNYAEISNSTMAGVDLSAHSLLATEFVWVYLPSTANLTSFTLRWGSSSSNYWSSTVTAQFSGAAFAAGWNLLGFAWASATQTGTVVSTAINYALLRMTYSAGMVSTSGFKVDFLRSCLPFPLDMHYYSTSAVISSASARQDVFSALDDQTIWEDKFDDMLLMYAASDALKKLLNEPDKAKQELQDADAAYAELSSNDPSDRMTLQSEW